MPRLAIIITATGTVESLECTLLSVLENRPADCEILVALNQPYADPYDLREEVRFVASQRGETAIGAINRALAATRAPFVHLLASGCKVSEGWADAALARFGDKQLGSVAALIVDERSGHVHAAGVGYRTSGKRQLVAHGATQFDTQVRGSIVGPCILAGFFRKAALELLGGLSTQLGLWQADADLGICLAKAGFTVALEPQSKVLYAGDSGVMPGALRTALYDERLFWRNLPQAPIGALAAHAGAVALELAGSLLRPRMFAQMAGRLLGCCQMLSYARHRRMLAELSRRALRPGRTAHDNVRVDRPHGVSPRPETQRARVGSR